MLFYLLSQHLNKSTFNPSSFDAPIITYRVSQQIPQGRIPQGAQILRRLPQERIPLKVRRLQQQAQFEGWRLQEEEPL